MGPESAPIGWVVCCISVLYVCCLFELKYRKVEARICPYRRGFGLVFLYFSKVMLQSHRMKNSLFAVLCEIKERTALSIRSTYDEPKEDPELTKLDNLLV